MQLVYLAMFLDDLTHSLRDFNRIWKVRILPLLYWSLYKKVFKDMQMLWQRLVPAKKTGNGPDITPVTD